MRVAIYTRVSTDDKDQNTDRQTLQCKRYCELHEHSICYFASEHMSGDTDPLQRPEFKKILALDVQGVIVFSIDRLSRQHPAKVISLITQLKDRGIKIVSITEPIFNMESEFAEPLQYILTWWNNYFLKKLKTDIKSGMERARAEGKSIGRPRSGFNKLRAYQLLMIDRVSLSSAAGQLGTSKATLYRFKRECQKNPSLYINK